MIHRSLRPGLTVLAVTLALTLPALAQEGDGMDINMDALKNRPVDGKPAPAAPKQASKGKKFTGKSITLLFQPGSAELEKAAMQRLDGIAAQSKTQRMELKAYAGDLKQSASDTRRLALQRAIAVRGYLMDKGMDGTRIAVRPQGPAPEGTAPERVDVRYLEE